jgi:hypothetical protein
MSSQRGAALMREWLLRLAPPQRIASMGRHRFAKRGSTAPSDTDLTPCSTPTPSGNAPRQHPAECFSHQSRRLEENGVRIIGTSPKNIELAEDRKMFAKLLDDLGLHQAPSGTATSLEEALAITSRRSATPASCAPASCSAAAPCRSSIATPNSPTT